MRFTCFRSYLTPGSAAPVAASGVSGGGGGSQSPAPARSPGRASRSSKSHENVYTVSPPAQASQASQTSQPQGVACKPVCLGARLRALSARCLALVQADRHKAHISAKPSKQRSFSSGALPGLHDFQRSRTPQPPLTTTPPNVGGSEEDGDSGILVGWPATPSCSSRAGRSASLDRELLGGLGGLEGLRGVPPSLREPAEQPEHPGHAEHAGHVRQSRLSTKSSSSSSEISEIFSRFQRRRVAGAGASAGAGAEGGTAGGGGCGSRPSSPPLLPAPPARTRPRAFHLVRLTRAAPSEELGIFIAKSDRGAQGAPGAQGQGGAQAAQGYVVAHVVPGGLAHRDGQLRLGDELVVVNGRQLRGLSMAAARQRLRVGPAQVDIVIARPNECTCTCPEDSGMDSGLDTSGDSMTDSSRHIGCQACGKLQDLRPAPRTLQESSVDYENVVLRPGPRQPGLPGQPQSRSIRSQSPSPSPSSSQSRSPSPSRSPSLSLSNSPELLRRQQLFQKHSATKARERERRSLGQPQAASQVPAETQHHSLKRRGKRGGGSGGGSAAEAGAARPGKAAGAGAATELRVQLRKGPGCGALGFTVVGGADSPRGSLPIFVRSVLEGGQAAQDGRLQPGDELVSLNGQPLRGATHSEAVAMFRAVRAGPVLLSVSRRTSKKAHSCSDLVANRGPEHVPEEN